MMYSNKLAVALKSAGKVLREFGDTVYVPFGTEYSILIKNLNTTRVRVSLTVDGIDATDQVYLIIDPRQDLDLTRFIKNGNLITGNRFKFIERTASVEQHRGIGIEDGLIRVEFEFEIPTVTHNKLELTNAWKPDTEWRVRTQGTGGNLMAQSQLASYTAPTSNGILCSTVGSSLSGNDSSAIMRGIPCSAQINQTGVTVPGSVTTQQFSTTSGFISDGAKHVIVLRMVGETAVGNPVNTPVTVQVKPTCVSCGRVNRATAKFCNNCGTSLVIV